jgi:hypothetical protein
MLEQARYLAQVTGGADENASMRLHELEKKVQRVKTSDLANALPNELPYDVPSTFWLSLRGYSPVALASQIKKPLLLLHAGRDFQVTSTDYVLWNSALQSQPWAQVQLFPRLNHLFESGEGPSTPTEYEQPSHVDQAVVAAIADWIDTMASSPSAESPQSNAVVGEHQRDQSHEQQ